MNRLWTRLAALLALVIGAMAVAAGANVVRGWDPGYTVIGWLPIYNLLMGLVSALVTAVLLWRNHRYALPAAVATLAAHSVVLVVLLTLMRETVARDSLMAMATRITVWVVILALAAVQRHKDGGCAYGHNRPQAA